MSGSAAVPAGHGAPGSQPGLGPGPVALQGMAGPAPDLWFGFQAGLTLVSTLLYILTVQACGPVWLLSPGLAFHAGSLSR